MDPRVLGRHCANRASTTCEVTYPLTRRRCLLMAYMPLEAAAVADEKTASVVNARNAAAAEREVYIPQTCEMLLVAGADECCSAGRSRGSLASGHNEAVELTNVRIDYAYMFGNDYLTMYHAYTLT